MQKTPEVKPRKKLMNPLEMPPCCCQLLARVNSKGMLDVITSNSDIVETRAGLPCPHPDFTGFVGAVLFFILELTVDMKLESIAFNDNFNVIPLFVFYLQFSAARILLVIATRESPRPFAVSPKLRLVVLNVQVVDVILHLALCPKDQASPIAFVHPNFCFDGVIIHSSSPTSACSAFPPLSTW